MKQKMMNVINSFKRLAYRVQPISHIRKRGARKEGQERRDQYYAFEEQLKSARKEFGYESNRDWKL